MASTAHTSRAGPADTQGVRACATSSPNPPGGPTNTYTALLSQGKTAIHQHSTPCRPRLGTMHGHLCDSSRETLAPNVASYCKRILQSGDAAVCMRMPRLIYTQESGWDRRSMGVQMKRRRGPPSAITLSLHVCSTERMKRGPSNSALSTTTCGSTEPRSSCPRRNTCRAQHIPCFPGEWERVCEGRGPYRAQPLFRRAGRSAERTCVREGRTPQTRACHRLKQCVQWALWSAAYREHRTVCFCCSGSAGAHAPCWVWPSSAWPPTGCCFAAAPLTTATQATGPESPLSFRCERAWDHRAIASRLTALQADPDAWKP